MASKQEALAALESAHDSFRAKIANLPDDAYNETWLGSWNLSQLLAHMGGWFNEMTGAMERVGRGERPTPEGVDYSDADGWNAKFAATATPGKAALQVWDMRFRRYADAAKALGEDQFGENEQGRPKIGNRLIGASGLDHFAEHREQLDGWLASRK
jgi:hypothetical protein